MWCPGQWQQRNPEACPVGPFGAWKASSNCSYLGAAWTGRHDKRGLAAYQAPRCLSGIRLIGLAWEAQVLLSVRLASGVLVLVGFLLLGLVLGLRLFLSVGLAGDCLFDVVLGLSLFLSVGLAGGFRSMPF